MTAQQLVYTLAEAAEATRHSERTLRRAIHNREPGAYPFVLRAKRDSRGRILIKGTELAAWIDRLEDA